MVEWHTCCYGECIEALRVMCMEGMMGAGGKRRRGLKYSGGGDGRIWREVSVLRLTSSWV